MGRKALVIDNFERAHFFPIGEEVELVMKYSEGLLEFTDSAGRHQTLVEGEFEWLTSSDSLESQEAEKTQSETF